MPRTPLPPSRRDLLRVGALGTVGLALPQLLQLRETQAAQSRPAADACIFLFLWGAPSQFETFDPKPAAPEREKGSGVIIDLMTR